MKKLAIITLILIILTVLGYFLLSLFYDFSGGEPVVRTVIIPKNSSLIKAANILEGENIIKSAAKFKILASVLSKSKSVKPGEYEFSLPDHPINILTIITTGGVKTYRVTIPEGWTFKDIANEIEKSGLGSREIFLEYFKDSNLLNEFGIQSPSLEGYMFPETYTLDKSMSEKAIIKTMLRRFFTEVTRDIITKGKEFDFNLHKIVTLASMIEKETSVDSERSLISSVFHNRLEINMRLQCDPTVIYGIENFDGNLTKKHLRTRTPYNTYKIYGLPKGPIANPGLASIKAAVNPDETEMLYFVAKRDGSHVFSKTYREHINNVNRYQLRRRPTKTVHK